MTTYSPTAPVSVPLSDRVGLGALLSDARRAKNMTQRTLEDRSGIPQGKISRIERGTSNAPLTLVAQLAAALDLDLRITVASE